MGGNTIRINGKELSFEEFGAATDLLVEHDLWLGCHTGAHLSGDKRDGVGRGIMKIPDNLTVMGSLDLSKSDIESLPDNLWVSKNLCLKGAQKVRTLPKGLIVEADLNICQTNIKDIPDDLLVGEKFLYPKDFPEEQRLKLRNPERFKGPLRHERLERFKKGPSVLIECK